MMGAKPSSGQRQRAVQPPRLADILRVSVPGGVKIAWRRLSMLGERVLPETPQLSGMDFAAVIDDWQARRRTGSDVP